MRQTKSKKQEEAGELLGVRPSHRYLNGTMRRGNAIGEKRWRRFLRSGRIRTLQNGRRILVSRRELDRFVDELHEVGCPELGILARPLNLN